jgi:hypothetical protein
MKERQALLEHERDAFRKWQVRNKYNQARTRLIDKIDKNGHQKRLAADGASAKP